MSQWIASLIGFLCGVGVTALFFLARERWDHRHRKSARTPATANALVTHDNPKTGNTEVDRTLIKPSPVPGWLAIVLVLFGTYSVVSGIVQNQRDAETRKQVRVAQCQSFAQLKFRGDDSRTGYTVLAKAIRKLTNPNANQQETIETLSSLADFYEIQGQDPGGLPPLSQKAINDCKDGVFNDGYPNVDTGPNPVSPLPQPTHSAH